MLSRWGQYAGLTESVAEYSACPSGELLSVSPVDGELVSFGYSCPLM